jgi:hypothetical protein
VPERTCTVDGCQKRLLAKGWCAMHYWRVQQHGSLDLPPREYPDRTQKVCTVDRCERSQWSKGLCKLHYSRRQRSGDVGPADTLVAARGSACARPDGYLVVTRPGHPLAAANGQVLEHRVVLYSVIGPGAHACCMCGVTVRWEASYPVEVDGLVVDHLDFDRSNNDPTNLRPACGPCNLRRTKSSVAS